VQLLAVRVDDEHIFIYTAGMFGITYMPMAWCCLSNAVCRRINKEIDGVMSVFVDDYIGFSTEKSANDGKRRTGQIISECVNPKARSESKSVEPTKWCDTLGWSVDLVNETFGPNQKGIDKLLVSFHFVDYNKCLSVRVYQLLSSLAERYSAGIKAWAAFVRPLHKMLTKCNHMRKPNETVKFCIDMWRIISLMLYADPSWFNSKISGITGYRYERGAYVKNCISVISDASPWKLGAAIWESESGKFLCYTSYALPFVDELEKYQNLREYLGLLLSLILVRVHYRDTEIKDIEWTNDNTTALSWAEDNKCASSYVHFANVIMSWFQIYTGINVARVNRIPGKDMGFIDDLSRDVNNTLRSTVLEVDVRSEVIGELFSLCSPSLHQSRHDNMEAFFRVHEVLSRL
jgi:hypothetical protein